MGLFEDLQNFIEQDATVRHDELVRQRRGYVGSEQAVLSRMGPLSTRAWGDLYRAWAGEPDALKEW